MNSSLVTGQPNDKGQAPPSNDADREAELTAPSAVGCTCWLGVSFGYSLCSLASCAWESSGNAQSETDQSDCRGNPKYPHGNHDRRRSRALAEPNGHNKAKTYYRERDEKRQRPNQTQDDTRNHLAPLHLTKKAESRRIRDGARESGTAMANRRWLQRFGKIISRLYLSIAAA